jgi:arylsulfatase A-like enzyme
MFQMKYTTAFIFALLCTMLCLSEGHAELRQQDKPPNFIFILTDDQPYDYMGCTGNEIVQTPHLDRLASDGILFTNAHITSAICTPSRVSIFLSQFERKHGVNFNSGTSVAPEAWEQSYPVVMQKAGYYTGYIGKNHSPIGDGGYASDLMEKSFDYWYAAHNHLSFYPKERHGIFRNAKPDTQVEIIGEGIGDFFDNSKNLEGAVHFLEQRPENKPFVLSICFNLPHNASTSGMEQRPTDAEIYKSLYRDKEIPLPTRYIAKADIKNPKLPPDVLRVENRQRSYDYVDTPETLRERYTRHMQAMTGIDQLVGALRKRLKELDMDNNTILIFTSDHGILNGQFGLGGKALCYEYATHVPMIIYDPRVPSKARGKRVDALVQSIDIAPTMLSLAGIPRPVSFQGKDLSDILRGEVMPVRDYLYTENLWSTSFGNPRCEAVQNKQWKYIRYYQNNNLSALRRIEIAGQLGIDPAKMLNTSVHDPDIAVYRDYIESPLEGEMPVFEELFNLSKDPHETTNIANDHRYKTVLDKMRKAWHEQIVIARGKGSPKVCRYTTDSRNETRK